MLADAASTYIHCCAQSCPIQASWLRDGGLWRAARLLCVHLEHMADNGKMCFQRCLDFALGILCNADYSDFFFIELVTLKKSLLFVKEVGLL